MRAERTAFRIAARAPRGAPGAALVDDPDVLAGYARDAGFVPGGHAAGVVRARGEADVAALLAAGRRLLPVGAQSSVTGGATPFGEVVLDTRGLGGVRVEAARATVGAGVTLAELQARLRERGAWFPAGPTFEGATVGGMVSTGAAGPATFKYGGVRDWVRALTVVLPGGGVLDVERGACRAQGGRFEIEDAGRVVSLPIPGYTMPDVPKRSAGYFSAPAMDLVDLFVGAEGTLGVVTAVTLDVLPSAPPAVLAALPCPSERAALALAGELRRDARRAWRGEADALDVRAVEYLDAASLALLREDGVDRRLGAPLPPGGALVLAQIEHAPGADGVPDGLLARLADLASAHLDVMQVLVAPFGTPAADRLVALREAVPEAVNARFARARAAGAPLAKVGADMIVPFGRLGEALALYRRAFEGAGVPHAIWGHLSDGNLHPNALPAPPEAMGRARAAVLALADPILALGGCPLAEHGVGRSPLKQALLARLYGAAGVEAMRALKRRLDPAWQLAPGVLFPP